MPKIAPVKQAILVNGQIVGWREIKPANKKTDLVAWAKSPEGQETYHAARINADADGRQWMSLKPAINWKTGEPYWKLYDPEMYE